MNWTELINACARGEDAAFREFVNRYYGLMQFLVARRIANAEDQHDILQEIFLKCHRLNIFKKFRGDSEGEWKSYLARICINNVNSFLGHKIADDNRLFSVEPGDFDRLGIQTAEDEPFSELFKKDLSKNLENAIATLPLVYRDIINLRILGHTNKEIGEILKKPKGTVDSYMTTAIDLLRQKFKKFTSDPHT